MPVQSHIYPRLKSSSWRKVKWPADDLCPLISPHPVETPTGQAGLEMASVRVELSKASGLLGLTLGMVAQQQAQGID